MKILIHTLIIIMSFYLLSCKSDNPVEPDIDYSNSDLATQLAHYKYSDSQYYLQFFPNGTFIQKQLTGRYNNDVFVMLYERTGKYKLEDNLIKLSELKIKYNTSLGGISIIWSDQEVSLVNNKISFKAVTVLDAEDNKNELWNYWTTIKLAYHYVESTGTTYNGRQEYFYEFISTNPKVRWGYNYLDGNPWSASEYYSEYIYAPPLLSLMSENYQVEFKNDKMYWYYKRLLNKSSLNSGSIPPLFPESVVYK